MQGLTRELAFDPGSWTSERAGRIQGIFDGLAPQWHTRDTDERRLPIADALDRGAVLPGGHCAEIGSGTGIHTSVLAAHFGHVMSVDLAPGMLALAPRRNRVSLVRGDAARLPVRARSLDAVVCVNAYLFPGEYARVLAAGGSVVFVSVNGDRTPIYLPPCEVVAALEATLGPCEALTALTGWGRWTVVRRRS